MQVAKEFDEAARQRIAYIQSLTPAKSTWIHISGVCGTGTGAVLSLLKQLGFYVSGSDKAFYPPMGDLVRKLADKVFEQFSAANLARDNGSSQRPDLVVIGNALSRGNPEVENVLEQGLPFASMPEIFAALLIGNREFCPTSVVVCGTHGKSTTTTACAFLLEHAKRRPAYFIGAVPMDLELAVRPAAKEIPPRNRVVVLEGDEYDSAFFAKYAKFQCYRPDIAVITSIEFDHADIYNSLQEIEEQFTEMVRKIPQGGKIFLADSNEFLDSLADKWRNDARIAAEILRYGFASDSQFRIEARKSWCFQELPQKRYGQELSLNIAGNVFSCYTKLGGRHNAANILAACALAWSLGVGQQQIVEAVALFRGVVRRQEVIAEVDGITVIEDFAHHPSAVRATLEAIKESYQPKRLIAVFDPRSNTSRRACFQEEYGRAFADADMAIIKEMQDTAVYSATAGGDLPLDVKKVVQDIAAGGTVALVLANAGEIAKFLRLELKSGDVVVLMSNGSFEGLPRLVVEGLREGSG